MIQQDHINVFKCCKNTWCTIVHVYIKENYKYIHEYTYM